MEDRVAKLVGKVPTAGLQPCLGWPQTRAAMGTAARELVFIRVPSLPVEQACHYSQLLGSSHLFFIFPSFLDKVSSLCNSAGCSGTQGERTVDQTGLELRDLTTPVSALSTTKPGLCHFLTVRTKHRQGGLLDTWPLSLLLEGLFNQARPPFLHLYNRLP